MNSHDDSLNLGPFLNELECRLDRLSPEQTRRCILHLAQDLPPSKRRAFLSVFSIPSSDSDQADKRRKQLDDPDLVKDIEQFVSDLENGDYYQGWGWDDQQYQKRAFGDESWVWEMEALFERCSKIFLAGNYDLAVKGYGKLLRAFHLEEEIGHFCGPDLPESMIDTDLEEAKARYLRAVYKTTPQGRRPSRLLSQFESLCYIGNLELGLQEIREAEPEELPEFEDFLPSWIELLKKGSAGNDFTVISCAKRPS